MSFHTLNQIVARGKRVLLRADLNVPLKDGRVSDLTRLERLCPTIRELIDKSASRHLQSSWSAEREACSGTVTTAGCDRFVEACVGPEAEHAAEALTDGEILVLENLRLTSGRRKTIRRWPESSRGWPMCMSTMRSPPRTWQVPSGTQRRLSNSSASPVAVIRSPHCIVRAYRSLHLRLDRWRCLPGMARGQNAAWRRRPWFPRGKSREALDEDGGSGGGAMRLGGFPVPG